MSDLNHIFVGNRAIQSLFLNEVWFFLEDIIWQKFIYKLDSSFLFFQLECGQIFKQFSNFQGNCSGLVEIDEKSDIAEIETDDIFQRK